MNPLHKLRSRAFRLGIAVHVLALRNFRRASKQCIAVSRDGVTVTTKPRTYCSPDLAGHRTIFKTETT